MRPSLSDSNWQNRKSSMVKTIEVLSKLLATSIFFVNTLIFSYRFFPRRRVVEEYACCVEEYAGGRHAVKPMNIRIRR